MYSLCTTLLSVKGIGPKLTYSLQERGLETVQDLLLFVPLHYEDRSLKKMIYQLIPNELVTVTATVVSTNNFYKGRRSIQSATVRDQTGRLKLMWFNNPYILSRLVKDKQILLSGKLNDRGTIIQPTIEDVSGESIHTGRLVPIYSSINGIAPTTFRKILKHVLDNLEVFKDDLVDFLDVSDLPLEPAIKQLHFPDTAKQITLARERLALEELLLLIQKSRQIKKEWQESGKGVAIKISAENIKKAADGKSFPFTLTGAQQRCIKEVLADLKQEVPMNRLLIGDVGSGKTAVAGVACEAVLQNGLNVALVAPTQILAEQHLATFKKLWSNMPVELVTSKTSAAV